MKLKTNETNGHLIKNAKYALIHIFPTVKSYFEFCNDSGRYSNDASKLFIGYAKSNDLIIDATEEAFLSFIKNNQTTIENYELIENHNFSELLEQVLKKRSVNSFILKLNKIADNFNMLRVQASMFSRLKNDFNPNTVKKRNILRLFSFWIGLYEPQLGWNYEKFINLPRNKTVEPIYIEKEGVRIAFSLQAVGDILDLESVNWLKSELQQCVRDLNLNHIIIKKISYTLSTAYLDLEKSKGPSGEPRLYTQAIRESFALAHQLSIRWSLSIHSNQQRSIIIAINAGPFDQADKYLQALLSSKISGITAIRVTEFARLCARIADVKIIFSKKPVELNIDFFGGIHLKAWYVDFLWSHLYYDFIPELIEENILPTSLKSYQEFKNELYFPDQFSGSNKALLAIRKFPQDALLAIEIAKVLVSRRMFYEAKEVLSTILASHPLHIVARTYRMIIYRHLFTYQSAPEIAENIFIRAIEESKILQCNFSEESEVCIESGLVYYSRAVQLISIYRGNTNAVNNVLSLLNEAIDLFNKSAAISPTLDMRAEFWKRQTKILQTILINDKSILESNDLITDKYDIIFKISLESWKEIGWIMNESDEELQSFLNRTFLFIQHYSKNLSLINYIPSLKCIIACQFWNTLPNINVFIAKMIISTYEETIQDVEKLSKYKIGIYSNTGCYTQIQTPERFIENANVYISIIKKSLGDDLNKADDYIIDRNKIKLLALPFVFLDNMVDQDPILYD